MQNVINTVAGQYGNSTKLLALINSFNDSVDPSADIDTFYNSLWNIDTAIGAGLDVWGRIVGVNRVVEITGTLPPSFGFNEMGVGTGADVFDDLPLSTGVAPSNAYSLSDDVYRQLILVKALTNISDQSIMMLNQALMLLFPNRGNAYVIDNKNMTVTYHFTFALASPEIAILKQSGALPGPTGCRVILEDITGTL